MARNPKVRLHIIEAKKQLVEVMQKHLVEISGDMVHQIMSRLSRLPKSRQLDATKDVQARGLMAYKDDLKTALTLIASDAIQEARAEVPKKRHVKLAEWDDSIKLGQFEKLPIGTQKRILSQLILIVNNQMSDLEKILFSQFGDSVITTDSYNTVEEDLVHSAEDYVSGASVIGTGSKFAAGVVNEARMAFFTDDQVLEEVEAFEFVNADPVSPICQDLAGTVFSKDDPDMFRYTPPLHFNCKSYIVPILTGQMGNREIEKLQPSTKKLEHTIQFAEEMHECWHLSEEA